jgi:phage shock protein A
MRGAGPGTIGGVTCHQQDRSRRGGDLGAEGAPEGEDPAGVGFGVADLAGSLLGGHRARADQAPFDDGPDEAGLADQAAGQRDPVPGRRSVDAGRQVQAVVDRKQAEMSLFQRAHDIVRARANKALDAAERPDEMLDLSYEDMLDQITEVKRALVSIAASRKHIELQEQQLQHTVEHLDDAARAALAQGKEDLAREALNRKAAAQQQIAGFDAQRDELNEQQQKMEQALSALQDRVNKFRSQKEVLKAQYQAARAQAAVSETTTGISGSSGGTGTELQRSMDKIEAMQARAGAMDELLQSGVLEDVGGSTDGIEQELDEAGRNAKVDKELAAMRAEIASSPGTPQFPARSD